MSVGPLGGIVGSAAGAPLSQTVGAEAERTQKESSVRQRLADSQEKSEQAAGIGTTEQDQEASDRDADGRRMWEATRKKTNQEQEQPNFSEDDLNLPKSKDPSGDAGNTLDLMG
jgi:hypothetical protein